MSIELITHDLEKAIKLNAEMRLKYQDNPKKFYDSEALLDEKIAALEIVNEIPNGYEQILPTRLIENLVELIEHDNLDISINSVAVLSDFVKILEDEEAEIEMNDLKAKVQIMNRLLDNNIFQKLHFHLERCSFHEKDEINSVLKALSIIESIIEENLAIAKVAVDTSQILEWLTKAIAFKEKLISLKLFASEVLSLLLQDYDNQFTFCRKNLLIHMLDTVGLYQIKDPEYEDEREFVKNIFDCINLCLIQNTNKIEFLKLDGVKNLLAFMKAKLFISAPALNTLEYALADCVEVTHSFFENFGLKLIFPVLMGKGIKSKKEKEQHEILTHCITIIYNLLINSKALAQKSKNDYYERILFKFKENGYEKTVRLLELRKRYVHFKNLAATKNSKDIGSDEESTDYLKHHLNLFMLEFIIGNLITIESEDFQDLRNFTRAYMMKEKIHPMQLVEHYNQYIDTVGKTIPPESDIGSQIFKLISELSKQKQAKFGLN